MWRLSNFHPNKTTKIPKQNNYESYLRSLQDQNLVTPSINISSFYEWRERRQESASEDDRDESRNPFLQWIQSIFGITTTTPSPPLTPPTDCVKCSCGKLNNNRIVGGTETGINQYPWMVRALSAPRSFQQFLGLINELLSYCRRCLCTRRDSIVEQR